MDVKEFAYAAYDEVLELIRRLCAIPAPSGKEEKRAEYCLEWFESNGMQGAYIDKALNVIFPYNCGDSDKITVFAAHTDTVFPDVEPMPFFEDDEKMYSPGIGDNTASLAVLMLTARYFVRNKIKAPGGALFVANSCEEGLGNLKGIRQLMSDYGGRIKQFVSFDSFRLEILHDKCVGSHRYEVEVQCEGGHSFNKFGNKNAIAELSKIITRIYGTEVPKIGDSHTTYNVGNISGGTSVNTIAQSATMLCEYRSDNSECLDIMKKRFGEIFSEAKCEDADVIVRSIGERPCEKGTDTAKKDVLRKLCESIVKDVTGRDAVLIPASTDCNVPLSMGIEAICISVYDGGGAHTREEWIEKESLKSGLQIAVRVATEICNNIA